MRPRLLSALAAAFVVGACALLPAATSATAAQATATATTFGGPTATAPGVPRYQILAPPAGSSANSTSGEFNIGFDPKTGNMMVNSWGDVFRVTPPELRNPALPEAGPSLWQDVSPSISSLTTADPILVTDQTTGRTFVSNQTTGAEALFAWTGDDGATWTQASVAPPNGGADHQTIGVGPYPSSLSSLGTVYPNAVYYCSQALLPDACQRSDSGGLQFGPGTVANTGVTCGGLHGHVKVAPDGTVYLPNKDCGGTEGGAVSTDAGTTWSTFSIPNSGTGSSDPSIGIDMANTAYDCYTPNNGSAHVAVSHDGGRTWTDDHDLGASVGVVQAVFPEAVGGDPGRAACGFVGTDTSGDGNSSSFPGKWYLFIATTYDGGKTWTTVNATPNDPVQGAGGICLAGTLSCGSNRNLLDFNEVTVDDRGRVLYGFDDGCVSDTCLQSGGAQNDFVADARIARQTGGKSLYAKYDPTEPAVPTQPYLTATRNTSGATLKWNAPDNGGSDITSYRILRGTSSGAETQIATVGGGESTYLDTTVDPAVSLYDYEIVAVNAIGSGPASNEVVPTPAATSTASPCTPPGPTILTDATGDSLTGTPGTDLRSLEVSQPYAPDGNVQLRFQLDTDPGTTPQPPGSYWYVSFKEPDGKVHGVRMWWDETNPTVPTFQSYVASPNASGGVDGRFVASGSTKPAGAASSYDAAKGTIVISVPLTDLGLNAGDTINGFNAGAAQEARTPVGGGAEVVDGMPNSLAYSGTFAVQANGACAPNTAPTAALAATPTSGPAPLQVAFDASASSDPDPGDSIASYTFAFGDGSAPVTQSTPAISHTYTSAGAYLARVTVTDSHGKSSTNDAVVGISVTNPPVCFEDDDAHIAYDSGWHSVSDPGATAGHFRTSNGKGLSFAFSTATAAAKLTYDYATSTKGGSADLYVDGALARSVSFKGGSGSLHSPVFGASVDLPLGGAGSHTFELRNVSGGAYVDRICITEGSSQSQPQSSPGATSAVQETLAPGAELVEKVVVPTTANVLSVLTESTTVSIPFSVVVVDPDGTVLAKAAPSSLGIASIDVPVAAAGTYLVEVLDLGLGPVQVWTAATPQVSR